MIGIAGVGTRSHAFIIDWPIRALLALGCSCGDWLTRDVLRLLDALPLLLLLVIARAWTTVPAAQLARLTDDELLRRLRRIIDGDR